MDESKWILFRDRHFVNYRENHKIISENAQKCQNRTQNHTKIVPVGTILVR